MIEVTLHFQANVANRLYDYFDDAYITKQSDGSFLLTVLLPAGEWLYSYILSFGGFAEVLEPESIRQIIGDRLKQACQLYEK
jgi:predicted DNA-binding transcriptional regulator YafY